MFNKVEYKWYQYTCTGSSKKFENLGWAQDFDEVTIRLALIEGKTYICSQVEGKPNRIIVSGFFLMRYDGMRWSDKPGFYTAEFKASTCRQFLKFTECFITKRQLKSNARGNISQL